MALLDEIAQQGWNCFVVGLDLMLVLVVSGHMVGDQALGRKEEEYYSAEGCSSLCILDEALVKVSSRIVLEERHDKMEEEMEMHREEGEYCSNQLLPFLEDWYQPVKAVFSRNILDMMVRESGNKTHRKIDERNRSILSDWSLLQKKWVDKD